MLDLVQLQRKVRAHSDRTLSSALCAGTLAAWLWGERLEKFLDVQKPSSRQEDHKCCAGAMADDPVDSSQLLQGSAGTEHPGCPDVMNIS